MFYQPDIAKNAKGGTELMIERLTQRIPADLLEKVFIVPSRIPDSMPVGMPRIFWAHDLVGDPGAESLKNEGWKRFDLFVFVSNWQMQQFIGYYGIPWSKCTVIRNGIVPVGMADWDPEFVRDDKIRLIYHTTPHRGLDILLTVFDQLAKEHPELELDVYSSFSVYGWSERDKPFEKLFEYCRTHPQINYHGAVPNAEVRRALTRADIFAYPSTWPETSCLSLIEAMSAGVVCVHSNYAALTETALCTTVNYQYHEEKQDHCSVFYGAMKYAIENIVVLKNDALVNRGFINSVYNIDYLGEDWVNVLKQLTR